jgi:hypothetical protein
MLFQHLVDLLQETYRRRKMILAIDSFKFAPQPLRLIVNVAKTSNRVIRRVPAKSCHLFLAIAFTVRK